MALHGLPNSTVLLNAYYLQEEATRFLIGVDEQGLAHVREVFSKCAALGVPLVRANAFNDGNARTSIQVAPLEFSETALVGMDHVLHLAQQHQVRLILPLGNYWDDYGGTRRYVAWHGFASPSQGDPRFFRERAIVEHYKTYIARILNRVNTLDGIRYGEHPGVFAWELMNEPRGDGLARDGSELRAWVDEVAGHLRALTDHAIGTGEEGFETSFSGYTEAYWRSIATDHFRAYHGISFTLNTASPYIDYASIHLYPDRWSLDAETVENAARAYVHEHAAIAARIGKPLVVGEFGLRRTSFSLPVRQRIYRSLLDCGGTTNTAALGIWLFHYDARPSDFDPQAFYWFTDTEPGDARNEYAELVREYARRRVRQEP